MEQTIIPTFDQLVRVISGLRDEIKSLRASIETLLPKGDEQTSLANQVSPNHSHILRDIDRACEITQKAKSTLYAIARRGDMPCIKNGKNWYFYEDELMDWIERGRHCHAVIDNEEMLSRIQTFIHHKPKSITGKEVGFYGKR